MSQNDVISLVDYITTSDEYESESTGTDCEIININENRTLPNPCKEGIKVAL